MKLYTLHEPSTGELRYIGITKASLERRLWQHLKNANGKNHRNRWLQSLKRNKQKPYIKPLCFAEDSDSACRLERFFIAAARTFGFDLVNTTSGGEGNYRPTEETRRKMSEAGTRTLANPENRRLLYEARQNPEVKARQRAAIAACKEQRAAALRIAKGTPEMRAKVSAEATARWADPVYKARVLATRRATKRREAS